MTREAVVHALARMRVGPEDLVGRVGGELMPLGDHPEFRGCWIPGSADQLKIEKLQVVSRRTLRRARIRQRLRQLGLLGLLAVTFGILAIGLTSRIFVAPSRWFDAADGWRDDVQVLLGTVDERSGFQRALPHEEWIRKKGKPAAERHPSPETALFTGQAALWRGGVVERRVAYQDLMAAVGRSPSDPEVLGPFVEAAASLRDVLPDAFADASRALGRMEGIGMSSIAHSRASAAMDLVEGNARRAAQRTAECATGKEADIGCTLLHGLATLDPGPLRDLMRQYPGAHRIRLILARVLLAVEDQVGLDRQTRILVRQLPGEGEGHALRAEACASTGRWRKARLAANRAVALDPWRTESLHLAAAIALRVDGEPEDALETFQTLISHPRFERTERRADILVQAADAARLMRRNRQAVRWIDEALREEPNHVGAQLVKVAIHAAEGDVITAKAVLRGIEHGSDSADRSAWSHLWAGRMYLELGLQRPARTELESAIEANPLLIAPRRELAWAQLETGDLPGAVSTIHQMVWLNPRASLGADPRSLAGPGMPPPREFRRMIRRAISRDVRMEPERKPTLALMAWLDNRPDAVLTLEEAIDWEEGRLEVHAALAQALLERGDWAAAIRHAEHVVQVRPNAGLFHAVMGRALSKLAAPNGSEQAFALALKHADNDPTVLWWAIEARQVNGDAAGARLLLERLVDLGVNTPHAKGSLLALSAPNE